MSASLPTLRYERALLRSGRGPLACVDEAGRGALSGPVSVGMVVVTSETGPAPRGVCDSKMLSQSRRQELAPRIRDWAPNAVGMASAAEIDEFGIVPAMQLAALRALAGLPVAVRTLLLDGNHDYITDPAESVLRVQPGVVIPSVLTRVQADRHCVGVAAASILAKTARDTLMIDMARSYPEYMWHKNKGYASPEHVQALRTLGPSPQHRTSWSLPQ